MFKYIPEADDYNNVVVEDDSDDEIAKYYGEGTNDFSTFQEMFNEETQNLWKRKIDEMTKDDLSPRLSKDEIRKAWKTWFKLMPKERKFRRPLAFFTRNPDVSLGDIFRWGWIPELNVFGIKREFRIQYFRYLSNIKIMPWWDV
ncbi:hypothetical protein Hanom_Chr14g01270271 [Helianthus anomalus]